MKCQYEVKVMNIFNRITGGSISVFVLSTLPVAQLVNWDLIQCFILKMRQSFLLLLKNTYMTFQVRGHSGWSSLF
jgi:hypothetical protein